MFLLLQNLSQDLFQNSLWLWSPEEDCGKGWLISIGAPALALRHEGKIWKLAKNRSPSITKVFSF